MSLIYL